LQELKVFREFNQDIDMEHDNTKMDPIDITVKMLDLDLFRPVQIEGTKKSKLQNVLNFIKLLSESEEDDIFGTD